MLLHSYTMIHNRRFEAESPFKQTQCSDWEAV